MDGYSGGLGKRPLNWSGGVNGIVSPEFVVFVSTLSRLFCVCGYCWGTYSPRRSLLLDLSGPLGKEGKAAWRGEEGKKGKGGIGKGGVALAL